MNEFKKPSVLKSVPMTTSDSANPIEIKWQQLQVWLSTLSDGTMLIKSKGFLICNETQEMFYFESPIMIKGLEE